MCIPAGFSAFFDLESGAAREQELAALSMEDAAAQGQHMSSGQVSVFLSSPVSAGHTVADQDSSQPIPAPSCEQNLQNGLQQYAYERYHQQ